MNEAIYLVPFDFTSASAKRAWQNVNHPVMERISTNRFDLTLGAAISRGEVSLENAGVPASVRWLLMADVRTGHGHFVVWLHGDGHHYKFAVRISGGTDTSVCECPLTTKSGAWVEQRLPVKSFVPTFRERGQTDVRGLDLANVTSVGFLIAGRQAGSAQLEIAWNRVSGPTL